MDSGAAPAPSSALSWMKRIRWVQSSISEAVLAEKQLLSTLKSPWRVQDVKVGQAENHYMHTIEVGSHNDVPIVLLCGYGAGSAFWWRNLDALGQHCRVYAVDWLGTGMSGRPPFVANSTEQAEDFFLQPLEAWRKSMGLERFILVGHSLGGYLAASYALRHPEQVMHLVLVGPAGLPRKPEDWPPKKYENNMMAQTLWKTVQYAWSSGVTPGAAIRTLGPWGNRFIAGYVHQRFANKRGFLAEDEPLFRDYLYQIMALPGSGEFALRHLLQPGAWAHQPMVDRLHALQPPLTAIYGTSDWMDPAAGQAVVGELAKHRRPHNASDLRVELVEDAGHFVMFEQADAFNQAMLATIRPHLGPSPPPGTGQAMRTATTQAYAPRMASERWFSTDAAPIASPAEEAAATRTQDINLVCSA